MKKWSVIVVLALMTSQGFAKDELEEYKTSTDSLYRRGAGSEDGAYTAISLSMLGWGLGLAAGIGIVASVLHQSTASHSSHSGECCH